MSAEPSKNDSEMNEIYNRDAEMQADNIMPIETIRFPIDNTMHIVFTGYYRGFSVELQSPEEITLLYHMGCFGKSSTSRSKPKMHSSNPQIIRKRQFLKRNYWYKKFVGTEGKTNSDYLLKEIENLTTKISNDCQKEAKKDVIDLVSSEEEMDEVEDEHDIIDDPNLSYCNKDMVIIVPNSDSEEEDYFQKLKPQCCINKIKIQQKLHLTLQEAFFLTYGLGCLQILSFDNLPLSIEQCWGLFTKTDRNFVQKYVVYHYFRSKGYIVKPGIKFGGDYLLYREGPGVNHADYIVVIKQENYNFDWISILGHIRMATTTVKEILIVEVIKPNKDIRLPEELSAFSVREICLNRKIPVTINDEID